MWLVLMKRPHGGANPTDKQQLPPKSEEVRWEMQLTPLLIIASALLTGILDAATATVLAAFLQEWRRSEAFIKVFKVMVHLPFQLIVCDHVTAVLYNVGLLIATPFPSVIDSAFRSIIPFSPFRSSSSSDSPSIAARFSSGTWNLASLPV